MWLFVFVLLLLACLLCILCVQDKKLLEFVELHQGEGSGGKMNWVGVLDYMGGDRGVGQCQSRWYYLKNMKEEGVQEQGSEKGSFTSSEVVCMYVCSALYMHVCTLVICFCCYNCSC